MLKAAGGFTVDSMNSPNGVQLLSPLKFELYSYLKGSKESLQEVKTSTQHHKNISIVWV